MVVKTIKILKKIKAKVVVFDEDIGKPVYGIVFKYTGKNGTSSGLRSPEFNSKEEALEWFNVRSNWSRNKDYLRCLATKRGLKKYSEEFNTWVNKKNKKGARKIINLSNIRNLHTMEGLKIGQKGYFGNNIDDIVKAVKYCKSLDELEEMSYEPFLRKGDLVFRKSCDNSFYRYFYPIYN